MALCLTVSSSLLSCTGKLRTGHSTPSIVLPVLRGMITSLYLLATILLMQPRIPAPAFAARAHCWSVSNLVFTRTPWLFSAQLPSSQADVRMGLLLPRCRTLLNCVRFLSAHCSSLSQSFWMAAWPSGVSVTPPSHVSSVNFAEGTLGPSPRSLTKMLNRTGPSTDLCEIIYTNKVFIKHKKDLIEVSCSNS